MTQDEILALTIEQPKRMYCSRDCGIRVSEPKPIADLEHTPTHTTIAVYESIGWFKRLMLNWCFGLKYRKL